MLTAETVTTWGTLFGMFIVAALNEYRAKQARSARGDLQSSNAEQHAKLDVIHALVNSAMGDKLKRVMEMAQRIYDASQDPHDGLVATQARTDYLTHLARQSLADQVPGVTWPTPAPLPTISDGTPAQPLDTKPKADK